MKFDLLPEETTKRKFSYLLLILGAILVIFALVNGISDNTPMTLLSLLGVLLFSTAFVLHWTEIKKFQVLLLMSIISLLFLILMHNIFYGLAVKSEEIFILYEFLKFLSVLFFVIVVFVCPIGIIIGFAGLTLLFIRKKLNKNNSNIDDSDYNTDSEYILDESDMGMKKE